MSDLFFTVDKDYPIPVKDEGGQLWASRDDLAQLVISLSYWGFGVWVKEEGEGMLLLSYWPLPRHSS